MESWLQHIWYFSTHKTIVLFCHQNMNDLIFVTDINILNTYALKLFSQKNFSESLTGIEPVTF